MKKRANGEGTVFFDKDRGKWVGQVYLNGKRRKVVAGTKTDAAARMNALRKSADEATNVNKTLTVTQLLDEWKRRDLASRGRAPSTVAVHEWAISLIGADIGYVKANDLTVRQVEQMLDNLAEDRVLSRSSLRKVNSTLTQALTFAQRRGDIAANVARLAKIPADATPPVPRSSLTAEQSKTLLAHLDTEWNGAMFALMLTLGLRPGEATGLWWEDLDLDNGTVNVTRGVRLANGRAAIVDDLKTQKAKRTVALPPVTARLLRSHKTAQASERLSAPSWGDTRLVFASPRGNVLSPPNVRRQFADLCARAGVPSIRPNELRHSCTSYLSDQGVSNEKIADLLGHTTTRMVDQTYRHRLRPVVDITDDVNWEEAR